LNKIDDGISSFTRVYSLFELLNEYHDKQQKDNVEYKDRSSRELTEYLDAADTSMRQMGENYDYHNYDLGVEYELRLEEMAANTQLQFFEESKELHSLSIVEMKAMFLYKEVEIRLKHVISSHYSARTNKLSNLNKLSEFFKRNGVNLEEIEGFNNINDLRLVSNDLKHSLKINGAKNIPEFKEINNFDSNSLNLFITQITYKIENFFTLLINHLNGVECAEVGDDLLGEIPF